MQHTVLGAGIRAGTLQPGDAELRRRHRPGDPRRRVRVPVALTAEQLQRFGNFLDDAANAQRERLKAAILATPAGQPITVRAYEWDTAYNGSRAAADRSADTAAQRAGRR